jgi:CheY-like chemotaxis protein
MSIPLCDEDTVLDTGRAMLETLGYTVLTAADGEKALSRAVRQAIDS